MILVLLILIYCVNSLCVISPSSYKYLTRLSCKSNNVDENVIKAFEDLINGLEKLKYETKGLNLTQIRNVLNETIIDTKKSKKNHLQNLAYDDEEIENPFWYEY